MAEQAPDRRRWYQFSLRTMFVVVTLFAVWLGWDLKIVRDRKSVRDWIVASGGVVGTPQNVPWFLSESYNDPEFISPLRRFLGDEPVLYVSFPRSTTRDDIDLISKTFPNAHHESNRHTIIRNP